VWCNAVNTFGTDSLIVSTKEDGHWHSLDKTLSFVPDLLEETPARIQVSDISKTEKAEKSIEEHHPLVFVENSSVPESFPSA